MNCIICHKPLMGKQQKFCSRKCHNKHGNNQHQSYSNQQKRGLTRKITLIQLLGGQCSYCSYKKNVAALEFHHTASNKESQLDIRKLSNSTWDWCKTEAQKCILLCANCHREHHNPHLSFKDLFNLPTLAMEL